MSSREVGSNRKKELEWDRSPHGKNSREVKFPKERINEFATAILEDDGGYQKKQYTTRNGPSVHNDEWKALEKEQKSLYDRLHRVKGSNEAGKKVAKLATTRRHLDLTKGKAPEFYQQVLDEAKNKTKSRIGGKKQKKITKNAKTEHINDSIPPSSDDELGTGDKRASQIKFEPTSDGDEPQVKRQKTAVVEEGPALILTGSKMPMREEQVHVSGAQIG